MHRRILIVVPCHNEAGRLQPELWREFAQENPAIGFLFVDDGSTDRTGEILAELSRDDPAAFELLTLPSNRGKAEAVRQGMLRGLAGAVDAIGYWDADLATPLETILTFADFLQSRPEIELVMGSRIRLLGHRIERSPARHVLGRIYAMAAARTLGMSVYDTQCGAKLFRASRAVEMVFAEPFLTNWTFDVEILSRLSALRLQYREGQWPRCYEYPLPEWRDVAGSKVRPRDFFLAFGGLVKIWLLRDRHPQVVAEQARPRGQSENPPPKSVAQGSSRVPHSVRA